MRLCLALVLSSFAPFCLSQTAPPPTVPLEAQPATPLPQAPDSTSKPATATQVTVSGQNGPIDRSEPTRILGVLPNFRTVAPGAAHPTVNSRTSFKLFTDQTLDYSAFVFGGLTSLVSEARNTNPSFGKGPAGFGQYLWRNNVDRLDRNFQQTYLFASLYHEDPHYYAMESGPLLRRVAYASTRTIITRTYSGKQTFNFASISGKLGSSAVSTTYYPKRNLAIGSLGLRLGYALGREAALTVVREFYPDVAAYFRHKRSPERGSEPYSNPTPQPLSTRPPA